MRLTFDRICAIGAACICYRNGQSVKNIAKSAKVSPSTIYRWLKNCP